MANTTDSNAEGVAELYDDFSEFYARICDSNLHVGYWQDADDHSSFQAATEHLTKLMIGRVAPEAGQRVLDVGCGIGQPSCQLASSHDVTVTGISVSRRQIEQASQRARDLQLSDRVRFELVDALELPYEDASFDAAWFFESLIHMPDKQQALTEAARVLRPGARLALADMCHEPGNDWSAIHPLVTSLELDEYVGLLDRAGFDVLDLEDVTEHIKAPEPVRRDLRAEMLKYRDEWIQIAGEDIVTTMLDSEVNTFYTPGLGYVLITAQRR